MTRWRVALLSALGLVVVSGIWWVPRTLRAMAFFRVRKVEVAGARYLAPETIVKGLELGGDANVFDDLGVLERRVAAMGGIAEVTVRRRLPATLAVEVLEAEPVALAQGPQGLVAVAEDGRPLPFDAARGAVDAPIVQGADRALLAALGRIRLADAGLYGDVAAARLGLHEVVLDVDRGRVRLDLPVDQVVVRSVATVRGRLAEKQVAWRELDARFKGWVVVRPEADVETGRRVGAQTRAAALRAVSPARRPAARAARQR